MPFAVDEHPVGAPGSREAITENVVDLMLTGIATEHV